MEEERDIVTFVNDDGDEIELEVMDYFLHDGQEYAVLTDADAGCDCDHEEGDCDHEKGEGCGHDHGEEGCACDEEQEIYIMKVVSVGEDQEEFTPVEEDQIPELSAIVQARFEAALGEGEDEDEDEDEDEGEK